MKTNFNIELDLGELFCDDETSVQEIVKREIVSSVVAEVKMRVKQQISDMLDVSIKESIDKHIGTLAREIMVKKFASIKSVDFRKDYKTYLMLDTNSCEYKIGKSKDPNKRVKQLQNPHLVLIGYVDFDCEDVLHNTLADASIGREFFDFYEDEAKEVLLFFNKDRY